MPIRLRAPHAPCGERSIGPSTPHDMGEEYQLFPAFTQLLFEAVGGQISGVANAESEIAREPEKVPMSTSTEMSGRQISCAEAWLEK